MISQSKIPFNNNFPTFRFPDFEVINLDNGIKVYLVENTKQALAGFRISIKRGSFFDESEGLTYMTAQMLTRGTDKHNAAEIASLTENSGAVIKTTSDYDDMLISGISLNEFFDDIIALTAECYFDSQMPEKEFEKIRKKHISAIMQQNSDIAFLAKYAMERTMFAGDGYGKLISGTIKSMKKINRNMVFDNYRNNFSKSPISIFLTGNFDKVQTLKFINELFSELDLESETANEEQTNMQDAGIAIIDKPSSNQAAIRMARKIVGRENPDFPYIQLVNTILGGFFMSRLNHILREVKGYTYGVHSMMDSRKRAGLNVIATSVNITQAGESVQIIKDEYKALMEKTITEEEMRRAVSYFTGSFLRSIETPMQITAMLRTLDSFNLDYDFYDNYYRKISDVTLKDLHRTVSKYFSDDNFVISLAGDLDTIKPQMEQFGNINILEIEE